MNMMKKMWFPKSATLLNMNEKAVYLHMEDSWKRNSRRPFTATILEMSEGFGISKSSVKRVVKVLKDKGVISSIQIGTGTHSQSLYTLEQYLTSDSDSIPNFLEDGSLLLDKEDVRYLLGTSLDDEELNGVCL